MVKSTLKHTASIIMFFFAGYHAQAQVGEGWEEYEPLKKVHLAIQDGKLQTFPWNPSESCYHETGTPVAASYRYDAETGIETFRLVNPGERSEIRVHDNYAEGSRQFEGYLTVFAPAERQMFFQIWGSANPNNATQMYLRAYDRNNGTMLIYNRVMDAPEVWSNIYNVELKVNVIHLQEDAGGRIYVCINDKKVLDMEDNYKDLINTSGNYHKYGCYGTIQQGYTHASSQWRNVRHFRNGTFVQP